MATGGVLGNKTKVGFSTVSSPLSYTTLGQLLNVVIPNLVADEIPTSIHGSLMKRNMPGMTDVTMMELTFLQDLDPATSADQAAMFTHQGTGATLYWRVEVPNQRGTPSTYTPFTFGGWVKECKPNVPMGDKQTLVVSVRFDDTAFTKGAAAATALG